MLVGRALRSTWPLPAGNLTRRDKYDHLQQIPAFRSTQPEAAIDGHSVMTSNFLVRRIERATLVYRELGTRAVLSRLARRFYRIFGTANPDYAKWEQYKTALDLKFDASHGTQTGGIQRILDLNILGQNAKHGHDHIATDPDHFQGMMEKLEIDCSQFSFIDFGSGKGRALIMAARFPFHRIVGVEFATELHDAAQVNIEKLTAHGSAEKRIELVCMDALDYAIPLDPLVIYLFNPFGVDLVNKLAARLFESWRRQPRELIVLYMNPVHLTGFLSAGWAVVENDELYARLTPGVERKDVT